MRLLSPIDFRMSLLLLTGMFCLGLATKGQPVTPPPAYSTAPGNYVRTWDATAPGLDPNSITSQPVTKSLLSTQYFDGLGRPIQTVSKQASPLQSDMVSAVVYDSLGREQYKYLPFTSVVAQTGDIINDGNVKLDPFQQSTTFNQAQFTGQTYYYGQQQFEPSPLNRVVTSYAAGNSWVGSGRGVGMQYLVNESTDSIEVWNISFTQGSLPVNPGQYAVGALTKTVTTDEQEHQVVEYKDKFDLTILKKVQSASTPGNAHVGWLCTYYVYDDLHNLRFVISPRAVEILNTGVSWTVTTTIANELCFRYEYDARNRMIIKKVPGAGEVHMVYDERDRLVMSQDSNLRVLQKWLFTCYDNLDRADSTGLMTDPANYNNLSYHTTAAKQSATYPNLASYTVELMTRNFYDNYAWVAANSAPVLSTFDASHSTNSTWFVTSYNVAPVYAVSLTPFYITRGMVTGQMKKVIGTTSQYLYSASFYDDRGRTIQTSSNNYAGGVDTVTTQYDFAGKPLRSLHGVTKANNSGQSHMILTEMDYDPLFRLRHIYKQIDGAASAQLIDSLQYDELGRLNAKYLGNALDSLVYSYNIRGWLTGINKNYVGGTTNHWFGMELAYDNATSIAGTTYTTPAYNGNIAGTVWKSAGDGIDRKYDFTYDNVNRLTGANFNQYVGATWGKSSGGTQSRHD